MSEPTYSLFADGVLLACGSIAPVFAAFQAAHAEGRPVQVFRDGDARPVDFHPDDTPGAAERRIAGLAPTAARGRPKLGVVGREVTLLPRHWDWLAAQPGGASVALRKLVEIAMRDRGGAEAARRARESAHRFLTAVGGDRPGYEAALRSLYAGDRQAFDAVMASWPKDLAAYAQRLASLAWEAGEDA
jgi:uncharacterized protein